MGDSSLSCIQETGTVTAFSGTFFLDGAFSGHAFSGAVMLFNALPPIPFQVKLSFQTLSFQTLSFQTLSSQTFPLQDFASSSQFFESYVLPPGIRLTKS